MNNVQSSELSSLEDIMNGVSLNASMNLPIVLTEAQMRETRSWKVFDPLFQDAFELRPHRALCNQNKTHENAQAFRARTHGEFEEAINLYSKSLRRNPGDFRCLMNRGYLYDRLDQRNAAIKDYQAASKSLPLSPFPYYNLGLLFMRDTNYAKAEKMYTYACVALWSSTWGRDTVPSRICEDIYSLPFLSDDTLLDPTKDEESQANVLLVIFLRSRAIARRKQADFYGATSDYVFANELTGSKEPSNSSSTNKQAKKSKHIAAVVLERTLYDGRHSQTENDTIDSEETSRNTSLLMSDEYVHVYGKRRMGFVLRDCATNTAREAYQKQLTRYRRLRAVKHATNKLAPMMNARIDREHMNQLHFQRPRIHDALIEYDSATSKHDTTIDAFRRWRACQSNAVFTGKEHSMPSGAPLGHGCTDVGRKGEVMMEYHNTVYPSIKSNSPSTARNSRPKTSSTIRNSRPKSSPFSPNTRPNTALNISTTYSKPPSNALNSRPNTALNISTTYSKPPSNALNSRLSTSFNVSTTHSNDGYSPRAPPDISHHSNSSFSSNSRPNTSFHQSNSNTSHSPRTSRPNTSLHPSNSNTSHSPKMSRPNTASSNIQLASYTHDRPTRPSTAASIHRSPRKTSSTPYRSLRPSSSSTYRSPRKTSLFNSSTEKSPRKTSSYQKTTSYTETTNQAQMASVSKRVSSHSTDVGLCFTDGPIYCNATYRPTDSSATASGLRRRIRACLRSWNTCYTPSISESKVENLKELTTTDMRSLLRLTLQTELFRREHELIHKELIRRLYWRSVRQNEKIFEQEDTGDCMYIILNGSVEIYYRTESNSSIRHKRVKAAAKIVRFVTSHFRRRAVLYDLDMASKSPSKLAEYDQNALRSSFTIKRQKDSSTSIEDDDKSSPVPQKRSLLSDRLLDTIIDCTPDIGQASALSDDEEENISDRRKSSRHPHCSLVDHVSALGESDSFGLKLGRLYSGDSFGQETVVPTDMSVWDSPAVANKNMRPGLQIVEKRRVTAVATERTFLLALRKQDYDEVLNEYKSIIAQECSVWLTQLPLFQSLNKSECDDLAKHIIFRRVHSGSPIVHQGEPLKGLYIVRAGKLAVKATKQSTNQSSLTENESLGVTLFRRASLSGLISSKTLQTESWITNPNNSFNTQGIEDQENKIGIASMENSSRLQSPTSIHPNSYHTPRCSSNFTEESETNMPSAPSEESKELDLGELLPRDWFGEAFAFSVPTAQNLKRIDTSKYSPASVVAETHAEAWLISREHLFQCLSFRSRQIIRQIIQTMRPSRTVLSPVQQQAWGQFKELVFHQQTKGKFLRQLHTRLGNH